MLYEIQFNSKSKRLMSRHGRLYQTIKYIFVYVSVYFHIRFCFRIMKNVIGNMQDYFPILSKFVVRPSKKIL